MTVLVEKSTVNVDEGIDNLIDGMIEDYNNWSRNDNMKNRFASNFSVSKGQKYIKIINDNCVKCFIVNTKNDKMFLMGDILKPAGWNAPARNKPRGNVLEGGFPVNWTGPLYLN